MRRPVESAQFTSADFTDVLRDAEVRISMDGRGRWMDNEGGRAVQAIGRSRDGWTTNVYALTDVIGRPYALMLTPGNVSDMKAAPALLERAGRMRYLLGDKGYDAGRLRSLARDAGATPVIPGRRNRKRTIRYDKDFYCSRHVIENAFCRLKAFCRVATRYDKLAANFLSGIALATAVAFWL